MFKLRIKRLEFILVQIFRGKLKSIFCKNNYNVFLIKNNGDLRFLVNWVILSEECFFAQMLDLVVVDYPSRINRYELTYVFLSLYNNWRIGFRFNVERILDTICDIFRSCLWFEREAFDLFGIKFEENWDLRRILLDYTFLGHPLRKDFPLTGYYEVRYDDSGKGIVYEPVELMQDYRFFDWRSDWCYENLF